MLLVFRVYLIFSQCSGVHVCTCTSRGSGIHVCVNIDHVVKVVAFWQKFIFLFITFKQSLTLHYNENVQNIRYMNLVC